MDYAIQYAAAVERPVRYMSDRDAFLHAIHATVPPKGQDFRSEAADSTPSLVYADWLDDHGEHGAADVVRRHVAEHGSGGHFTNVGFDKEPPDSSPFVKVGALASDGSGSPYRPFESYSVRLYHRLPEDVDTYFTHVAHQAEYTPDELHRFLTDNEHLTLGKKFRDSLEKVYPYLRQPAE